MKTTLLSTSPTGIDLFEMTNENGMIVQVISYGARLFKVIVPDKNGNGMDIVAGFDEPDEFRGDNPYFNAVIGRVANRIGGANFSLNGKTYSLYKNDGNNSLHGGKEGFDRKLWRGTVLNDGSLRLTYQSVDGEEGYPGTLDVSVSYKLSEDNSLIIEYEGTSDADTVCGLTNHAYFNLNGKFDTITDHEVFIDSDKITLIDSELIPHGEYKEIKNTAYDFSSTKKIGKDIKTDDFMLNIARGYDFNYVLNQKDNKAVASAYCPDTGIKMEVFTDRPCMQLYTGNFLDGLRGKKTYGYQSAFCMETQGYPNACNVPSFASMLLKKGEKYQAKTAYRFSIQK